MPWLKQDCGPRISPSQPLPPLIHGDPIETSMEAQKYKEQSEKPSPKHLECGSVYSSIYFTFSC